MIAALLSAGLLALQLPASPLGPSVLSSFVGLSPGDPVVSPWRVAGITVDARRVSLQLDGEPGERLTFQLSTEEGPRSPFDLGGVRVSYEDSALPFPVIERVGKALSGALSSNAGSATSLREALEREVSAFRDRQAAAPITAPSADAPAGPAGQREMGFQMDVRKPTAPSTRCGSSGLRFRDVTPSSGLRRISAPGSRGPRTIKQTDGNGAAFLDYDRDGNLDILLVGTRPAIFRGDGRGRFTDVTARVLGRLRGAFTGCAVGDYDNDGWDDVYLAGYVEGRLLRNHRGARFRDVTVPAGVEPEPWGTSASFTDLDRDGWLDLVVVNYVSFGPYTRPQLCAYYARDRRHRVIGPCGPRYYDPLPPRVWRNRRGRFEDATQTFLGGALTGKSLGVAALDFDGSGRDAIAVANDMAPGALFVSNGGDALADIGPESGTSYGPNGEVHAGMGIDWGDYDNDGRFDLVVTTFKGETKSLYRNDGDRLFTDVSLDNGLGKATFDWVAFGIKFLDADNDGWLDLAVANGHVQDNVEELDGTPYRQPTVLARNCGANGEPVFEDVSESSGIASLRPIVGRGLAAGDYDNDGRVDLLIVDFEGPPLLLHNETVGAGTWLSLQLEGVTGNRSALGAVVRVTLPDGRTLVRHCQTDGSFLSASDRRVHVGLGDATSASVTVRWTSGATDRYESVPVGRTVTLREGSGGRPIHDRRQAREPR